MMTSKLESPKVKGECSWTQVPLDRGHSRVTPVGQEVDEVGSQVGKLKPWGHDLQRPERVHQGPPVSSSGRKEGCNAFPG